VVPKGTFIILIVVAALGKLTSESVEGTSLSFQGIDYVHGGDGLPLGVFGICDGISDDILKEYLEHSSGLFVDEARDTFHTSTSG
jgi:hypothetical protein